MLNILKVQKASGLIVLYLVAVCCVGCAYFPVQPDLPEVMDRLLRAQEDYLTAESEQPALEGVTDAALTQRLSGCWAMYRPAGGEIPVPLWSVYQFDSQKREFVQWMLQDPFSLGLFRILVQSSGTFEIIRDGDAQVVRFTAERMRVSDQATGALVDAPFFEAPEISETRVGIIGDILYLKGYEGESTPGPWRSLGKIDCVE